MTALLEVRSGAPAERALSAPPVVAALLLVLAGLVSAALLVSPRAPGDGSAEVGFARDMSAHHAQAVEMAEAVRDRTRDPELRLLAADIALTQQSQIGMMAGWLQQWGVPSSSSAPRMAWMGEPTTGLMPGMSGPDTLKAIRTLPVAQAEAAFLRAMVAHHTGGVAMARAGAALAERPEVVGLARGIAAAQTSEIEYLQALLATRGQPPAPVPVTAMASTTGSGHEVAGPRARDALLLTVLALGLVALAWLLVDVVLRRLGARRVVLTAPVAGVALGASVSAASHLALVPGHASEQPAYGLFFLLGSLALAAGAALVLAGALRTGSLLAAGTSLLLTVVYVLFRLVPPPFADRPEAVGAWGVGALVSQAVVLAAAAVLLAPAARERSLQPA